VFYASKKEAEEAGYTDYTKANVNKWGQIHPFGGIRGDARDLYNAVRGGKEPRIRLLHTDDSSVASTHHMAISHALANADVIVWACGYQANLFPIYGKSGEEITLRTTHDGQVDIDEMAQVSEKWVGAVVPNLYAIGLGFGFRSKCDGEDARSDGVGVYQKKGATIILSHFFGDQVRRRRRRREGRILVCFRDPFH